MAGQPGIMQEVFVEPQVSVWRKLRTCYFNLPLIACESIWRGGKSSTRWNSRRENFLYPFLQSVCRSEELYKHIIQQVSHFLSILRLRSEGRRKHWEENCPVTINEDAYVDTDISYGLSNPGHGARSFTLSCASQRVEFSHPYLLYWLRRRSVFSSICITRCWATGMSFQKFWLAWACAP